ncbi:MAG TPA: hypothetical protein VFP32_03415 [Candidatus Saccharimonadales bacterium]|nr:hypothetical protein [Candidatus Saccharimonadales bacterium]
MSLETKSPPESVPESSGEKPLNYELIVARHAEYFDTASENRMFAEGLDEAEIKSKLGRLTENGVQQAAQLGVDVLKESIASGQKVDITFIGSAQEYESPHYTPPNPWAGKRAQETAMFAATAAATEAAQLAEAGKIQADQVTISTPVIANRPFNEADQPHRRLVERDVYYSPKSKESLIDVYRALAKRTIEQGIKTPGHETLSDSQPSESAALSNLEKELWARGDPKLDEFAAQIGNETSTDVSGRIMQVVADITELAQAHQQRHPDRKLVVVLVAHDANIGALSAQAFGMEKPIIPTFTGRLNAHIQNGVASVEYDGKSYQSKLPPPNER